MCNKNLGTSTIDVKINGCSLWETTVQQKAFEMMHMVPAHVLDLEVKEVAEEQEEDDGTIIRTKHTQITEFFVGNLKSIDLREKQNLNAPAPSDTEIGDGTDIDAGQTQDSVDQVNKGKMIRFQYDGDIQMSVTLTQISGEPVSMGDNCTQGGFFEQDTDKIISSDGATITSSADKTVGYSFQLVETEEQFEVKADLFYELLPGLTCSMVPPSTTVRFINKVGIDKFFDSWAVPLSDKQEMAKCSSDTGCTMEVQHDELTGLGAHVNGTFRAGRPNIYNDFVKDFVVEVLDEDYQILGKHHAYVVVTGDYKHGRSGDSISLPTYEPLMILRDPPGGLSTATYENFQSTIEVTSSEYESLKHSSDAGSATTGWIGEMDTIAGTPFAGADIKTIVSEGVFGLGGPHHETIAVIDHTEKHKTVAFTTVWSYTTSDDPTNAGRNSDVMVIPTIYVELTVVDEIQYNSANCSVTRLEKVKFSVDETMSALSFLSVYHIEGFQIPKIETARSNVEAELKDPDLDDKTQSQLEYQKDELDKALNGWDLTMAVYEESTARAWGKEALVPKEWFQTMTSAMESEYDLDGPAVTPLDDHWSALTPEVLAKGAQSLGIDYTDGEERRLSNTNDIKDTNIIHFSGGGSTIAFELNHEGMKELTKKDSESSTKSEAYESGNDWDGDAFVAVGYMAGGRFEVHSGTSREGLATKTAEIDFQTSISFELGDEQSDDEFAVQLAVDDVHRTVIFKTLGGVSSQPHENGTVRGEDLVLKVDRPTKPVLPDEPLVFTVTVENNGRFFAECGLALDQSTNYKGLLQRFGGQNTEIEFGFGGTLAAPTFSTTLEVFRGPQGYLFEPTWIDLFGTWDSFYKTEGQRAEIWNWQDPETDQKWIRFEEPCPGVEWSGDLGREKKAVVNKTTSESTDPDIELSIFNPRANDGGSLQVMRDTGRLQTAIVEYRKMGSVDDWQSAKPDGQTEIDFAADITELSTSARSEDTYGYALFPWKMSERIPLDDDGSYEVTIKSTCKPLSGAPNNFNEVYTEPIMVVLDRVPPKIGGSCFTEPINCGLPYHFDIIVRLSGRADDDYYDERRLDINCEGHKLGFQFDISRLGIRPDEVVGRDLTVTVKGVTDLQGNLMEGNSGTLDDPEIVFTMAMANLELRQVATAFTMTIPMESGTCSADLIDPAFVRSSVFEQLGIDESRIEVGAVVCQGNDMVADLTITHPEVAPSQRRLGTPESENGFHNDLTAVDAYNTLIDASKVMEGADRSHNSRKLASPWNSSLVDAGVPFTLRNLKLIPGPHDIKRFSLDAAPTVEEESILAVARGVDLESVKQQANIFRLAKHQELTEKHITELDEDIKGLGDALEVRQNEVNLHMDETDMHIDKLAENQEETNRQMNETNRQMNELARSQSAHMHELDEKVDLLLAQILKNQEPSRLAAQIAPWQRYTMIGSTKQ